MDAINLTAQDLVEHGLFPKDGIKQGDLIHLKVVGPGQVSDGISFIGKIGKIDIGVVVMNENFRLQNIPWKDILEIWPIVVRS